MMHNEDEHTVEAVPVGHETYSLSIEPSRLDETFTDRSVDEFFVRAFQPEVYNLIKLTAHVVRHEMGKPASAISSKRLRDLAEIYAKLGPLLDGSKSFSQDTGKLQIIDTGEY